ncbi:T9SS type A sorting domain-containing protein [Olleya sp. Bg11-27]|uniref:T9SS type A sorting domain-containing protein n=1 Tax=Olleya sp. Bg11-27 TaxID=2058135 RepID=UPI000C311407|nr:RICIN domain-containing protein [Olleya sp. Bg11-27]AUC74947.1 hypothetical protein CW732_04355 [Olleya sp. Bg11-27]
MKVMNVIKGVITLVILFSFSSIHAQRIYVSKTGNDANPGTVSQPFKTIAKASAIANPGNTIVIGEGTYEETIKPLRSGTPGNPIVYTSKQGEKVIISAMEALSGWTSDGGSVWKTTVNWDLEQRNFVIRGATVLDLARWPNNTDGDRFTLNSLRNDGGSQDEVSINAFLTDRDIPNWQWSNGGSIMFYGDRPGSGWTTWRAWIKSQSSGRVTFDAVKNQNWIIGSHPPGDFGDYYLEGIKEALDYQNEWYFDASANSLFVQLPGGVKPKDGEVQMARRAVTANLENRDYIHIENLALFGGNVLIKGTGNKLKGVKVLYGSMTRGITPNFNSGINAVDVKGGSVNTIIENSEIGFGDATGIWDSGNATIIRNNYIHDFDFLGSYDAPIMARGGKNSKILRNNISRGGRDGIQIVNKNSEVAWNDISRSNLIADDCALLYTINKGLNMDIHHNWFHDAEGRGELKKAAGIYLDNDAENVRIYRNVVWNVEWTNIQINWNGKDIDIFNNTLVKADGGTMGAWHKAGTAFTNVKVWNNITDTYRTDQGGNQETEGTWEPQSNKQNNLVDQTSFVNFNANNYRLNNGTVAVDAGRVISGYTDSFIGVAPDVGAYEVGDNWIPGPNWDINQGPTGVCYDLPGENCTTTGGEDSVRPDANLANGVYYIQNTTNEMKINSPNGRRVNIAATSENSAKWQITKAGTYYTIKNLRNNEFLEVPYAACNINEKAENLNVNLGTWTSVGGNHQKWGITKVNEDYFLEPLHCEKVVDRNNGNTMHLWPYVAGNTNQNWKIIRVEDACSANMVISNLERTDATNTTITVTFDTFDGVNTYEVRAWPKGQFTGYVNTPTAAAFKAGNFSPITIDGLTAGTEYTVVIRAICATGGTSELTQIDTFTSGPCAVDAEMTSVKKVSETDQSISIGFNQFTGSNTYELRAWPKGQFTGNINSPSATSYASGTSSPITINGLAAGTEYTLVLRAICSQGGASKLMAIDSATSGAVSRNDTTIKTQEDTIVLYPTPLKEGVLTIFLGHATTSKVSILDLQGNTVYRTETNEQHLKIDRSLFGNSGFYFVRIEQQGVFTTKKIIVN